MFFSPLCLCRNEKKKQLQDKSDVLSDDEDEIGGEVLPLEVLQEEDSYQLKNILKSLGNLYEVIFYYLDFIVFPATMKNQQIKLQATGLDLGSDILFSTRLGFSGTPSEVLPRQLRPCFYEKGSEAQIMKILTSDSIQVEFLNGKWNVDDLLNFVASQKLEALIDAGALITGLSNEQVARLLLQKGLDHMDGCIFLDHRDRKMIVDRTSSKAVPLYRSGIPISKRFTFYDQVSPTLLLFPLSFKPLHKRIS